MWLGRAMSHTRELWNQHATINDAWESLHKDLWTPSHSVAPEAIPQLYAILHYSDTNFREALFWAANFGRDADTITAVVGAICGARHGLDIIPKEWVSIVRKPTGVCLKFTAKEDIIDLSRQLADLIR